MSSLVDTQSISNQKNKPGGYCNKLRAVYTNITVEPILLLYLLPSLLTALAIQNLDLEKACRVNLNLTQSICDGLASRNSSMYTPSDEAIVQKLVASMNAWKGIIRSVIPALTLLYLGSWADRHQRRKPCMLIPIIGEIVTSIGVLFCTYYFYELPMEITGVIETLPPALTGGWATMFMAIFSYIGAISSLESRTVRIGVAQILSHISFTLGLALGGVLSVVMGFYGIFSITLCMQAIGLIYGLCVIKEVPSDGEKKQINVKKHGFLRDLFDVKHFSDTLKIAFKRRQKNWRKRIFIVMLLVMVVVGPLNGELSVIYLFTRYRFGWNTMEFGTYYTYNVILHIIGTVISLTVFSKWLKFDDAIIGIISCLSKVISSFAYAFAPNTTAFYLAVLVEILNGTALISLRSIISKLVEPEEIGKINSLFGVVESLMPLVYGPLYSLVYKATIDTFPGTFFLVGGGLTVPAIFMFLWLFVQHKHDAREEKQHQEHSQELLTIKNNK